ncbi:MAG: glycosyltransferase family 2 protein [Cyanobacteria bacterium J06623_7]
MMKPLVSIGMPIYNCQNTIRAAVNSILNQTYDNWELILIDDGSQDDTLAIASSFNDPRIKVITDGTNLNLPNRLNQAIDLSQGKYFARMDGDDISYPERLAAQVAYLENHPEVDLLATNIIAIDNDSNPTGTFPAIESHEEICRRPWAGFPMTHPTWMGRLSWFQTHRYRPEALRTEDTDLMIRTFDNSRFAKLPEVMLGYRVGTLSLKKILPGRYYTSVSLVQKALNSKKYLFALGVIEQAAKAAVDIVAIGTGLNFKLLKHRVGIPLSEVEQSKWRSIWEQCNS